MSDKGFKELKKQTEKGRTAQKTASPEAVSWRDRGSGVTTGYSLLAEAAATVGQSAGSWSDGEVTGTTAWRTRTPLRE